MVIYVAALLLGVIAGLRTFTAPMMVSWAVRFGWVQLGDSPFDALKFLYAFYTPYILTVLAIGELIGDKLKWTPSRKIPPAFIARIVSGAICGAAVCSVGGLGIGALLGGLGAVIGTLLGYKFRVRLAAALGKDLPAALVEDAIAVGGGFLIVATML